MSSEFTKGQIVRGVVTGRFVVVSTTWSDAVGEVIVTVKHMSECGMVARSTMRFPASVLKAE